MDPVSTQAIGQAVGSLVVPAVEGGKGIFNWLKRNRGYVKNLSKNFAELEKQKGYLSAEEKDAKRMLESNNSEKEQTHRCGIWLKEVETIKGEFEKLKKEKDEQKSNKYLCGSCPFSRLRKLGKRIVKMTRDIVNLKDQKGQITIMINKPPTPAPPAPPPVSVMWRHGKKINDVPSLHKHVETLLEWLRDNSLKRICIWGPPGVGKTTIMENLHDRVGESHQFDIIFWVTVTTERSVREIQKLLWKRLEMKVDEDINCDQKAYLISEKLKSMSYILFLDEVFSEINLKEVGIHDDHELGKVVFACRYNNICGHTDEDLNVLKLSEDDAQKLFWEMVGAHLKDNRHIKPMARKMINECGGMPHMIKLIGKSLANKNDPALWRDTLNKLQSPSMEPMQELEEVYKSFKIVCEKLHEEHQQCLLYWAIFPIGCEIHRDHIIECWRAEQFITGFIKLGKIRDRGHALLHEFITKSLLEKGRKAWHYKMFEHFQRVALRIANLNDNWKILVTESSRMEDEEWGHADGISLIRRRVSTTPEMPKCCHILTLLLKESNVTEFSRRFFGYLCGLQVLDLHDTRIRSLPSSISCLINLKVLFLNDCSEFVHLPKEIADLQSLEILDLRHTGIHSLPNEIGQLTNLRCLKVSFEEKENVGNLNHHEAELGEMIPHNIISRLSLLEELSINVEPNNRRWNRNIDGIVKEVALLKELTTLNFSFPELKFFEDFIDNSESWGGDSFRSFSILVGYHQRNSSPEFGLYECSAEKHLRFSAGEGFPNSILQVLEQACAFELIGHQNAKNLSDFGAHILGGLEACMIEQCNEMESIINGGTTESVAFKHLKMLHMNNLPKLERIWEGLMGPQSLTSLITLTLRGCPKVKMLFSQEMVLRLSQLGNLTVEDCSDIKEIVYAESIIEPNAFPKLKHLELHNLPQLHCICQGTSLEWPSLETILINMCKKLNNLPSTMESATKLRVIQCTEDWWNQLVWPNYDVKERFQILHHFN